MGKREKISKTFKWVSEVWPALAFIISIIGIITAWLVYDVSLLHPLKKIAAEQREYNGKSEQKKLLKEMAGRHLALGKSFLDNSRYMAARGEFESVLKLDKLNPEAQMGLFKTAVYKAMQNEFIPEVIERRINFILKETPDDPHALVFLGNLYAQLENIDKAEEQYELAIKSDNKTASAYFGLGIIYEKQNEIDKALEKYKDAVKLSKWNERYLNNLASVYSRKGDYENAIKNYELILTLDYEYLLPYLEISIAFLQMGNLEKAYAYQDKLAGLLEDEYFYDNDKNKGVWFFNAEDETVELFSIEEKRLYTLYSLSMTLFLLGDKDHANEIAGKAQSIKTDQDASIRKIVSLDLQRFVDKHQAYKEQVENYRTTYLQ